jgi:hypothetical protein
MAVTSLADGEIEIHLYEDRLMVCIDNMLREKGTSRSNMEHG